MPRAAHSSLARLIPSSQAAGRQVIFILSRRLPHPRRDRHPICHPPKTYVPNGRKRYNTCTTHSTWSRRSLFRRRRRRSVGRSSSHYKTLQDSLLLRRRLRKCPVCHSVSPIEVGRGGKEGGCDTIVKVGGGGEFRSAGHSVGRRGGGAVTLEVGRLRTGWRAGSQAGDH